MSSVLSKGRIINYQVKDNIAVITNNKISAEVVSYSKNKTYKIGTFTYTDLRSAAENINRVLSSGAVRDFDLRIFFRWKFINYGSEIMEERSLCSDPIAYLHKPVNQDIADIYTSVDAEQGSLSPDQFVYFLSLHDINIIQKEPETNVCS